MDPLSSKTTLGDNIDANAIGARIKQRMEYLGISQASVCHKTGINSATMSQYISGKYRPSQPRIDTIAKVLKTTPQWLAGWSSFEMAEQDACLAEIAANYANFSAEGKQKLLELSELLVKAGI